MSYVSDYKSPGKLCKSLGMPFFGNLKVNGGEFVCFLSLFFDNLSTMVGTGGAFVFVAGNAASEIPLAQDLLYKRMVPACGLMLFLGNFYMAWLGTRMKTQYGRDFTAQPYGINTVGAFPFVFNIMTPIAGATGSIETAWKAGCTGNFIVGCINVILGILLAIPAIGNKMLKVVPVAALTIPVAGVGLTWLCINQIAPNFGTPVAGFIPLFMLFIAYYSGGGSPIKFGRFTVPPVLMWIVPGYILGWCYQLPEAAADGYKYEHPGGGLWIGGAAFEGFDEVGDYIGTILPLAVAATAGDLMCLVSARLAGDPYPIGEVLIVDGLFTIVGSIFGSPFGTVVYFGHPVHKRLGGKYTFSFVNGLIYLVLTLSGLFELIAVVSPKVAIGPTIAIFGFMLAEECTNCLPQRHHAIIFFALFFGFADYFTNAGVLGVEEQSGLSVMKKGALLNCAFWSAMLVYAFDCRWLASAAVAVIASIFAVVGITHQDKSFSHFTQGFLTGGNDGTETGKPRYSCSPIQFFLAYLSIALVCLFFKFCQKTEPIYKTKDEKDDEAMNAKICFIGSYDKWWEAAAGDVKKAPPTTAEA